MGSLTSRPKVPATLQPQIITVTQPVPATNTNVAQTDNVAETEMIVPQTNVESGADGEIATNSDTEVRITNLLRRNRGLSGTIQTGFRGLLSASGIVPQRKTLLGE